MSQKPKPFEFHELGNTYCGARDRFVVSLIVGYAEDDGVTTPKQAGAAALALTNQGDSQDTNWYVFDRKTGEMTLFEQKDLEGVGFGHGWPADEEPDTDLSWLPEGGAGLDRKTRKTK